MDPVDKLVITDVDSDDEDDSCEGCGYVIACCTCPINHRE